MTAASTVIVVLSAVSTAMVAGGDFLIATGVPVDNGVTELDGEAVRYTRCQQQQIAVLCVRSYDCLVCSAQRGETLGSMRGGRR
jgi:hypothetical protein